MWCLLLRVLLVIFPARSGGAESCRFARKWLKKFATYVNRAGGCGAYQGGYRRIKGSAVHGNGAITFFASARKGLSEGLSPTLVSGAGFR
jgi:hypothetical protein